MRINPIERTYPTRSSTEKDPRSDQRRRRQEQKKDGHGTFQHELSKQLEEHSQIADGEPIDPPKPIETDDLLKLYEMERLKCVLRGNIK